LPRLISLNVKYKKGFREFMKQKSMIRQLLVAVITLAALLASRGIATAADYYSENFQSYSVNTMPSGWIIKYNGAGDSFQGVRESSGNQYLQLQGVSGWSAVLRRDFSTPMPENAVFTFDVYRPGGTSTEAGAFGIGSGSEAFSVNLATIGLTNQTAWHSVRCEVDFLSNTATAFVNGSTSGTAMNYGAQNPSAPWSVWGTAPAIFFDSNWSGTMQVDNISVAAIPEPTTGLLVGAGCLLLLYRRRLHATAK
jgi:hypothetical protein